MGAAMCMSAARASAAGLADAGCHG